MPWPQARIPAAGADTYVRSAPVTAASGWAGAHWLVDADVVVIGVGALGLSITPACAVASVTGRGGTPDTGSGIGAGGGLLQVCPG